MTEKSQLKKALQIGFVCIFTYVASYYLRNLLSVLTPQMIESNAYTAEYLALLASIYMIVYAAGQLVNGIIGDHVKPKYMVTLGLLLAAVALLAFYLFRMELLGMLAFGLMGFGLSMLRGPLVKVISENTLPKHARVCCVFLSFSGFAGPLLAGLVALLTNWSTAFLFSALVTLAMAAFAFFSLTLFEKKGLIVPVQKSGDPHAPKAKFDLFALFRLPNFVLYMIVGMVVEIAAASINFWMPTYFNQYLEIHPATSTVLFSVISLLRSFCPFLSLFIFKLFRERDVLIVRVAFTLSAMLFAVMFFVSSSTLNVVLFTLALMCSSVSSATLWSIYIPSLGKSGKVSSANGVLDCTGYAAAALVNVAIVPIMNFGGWGGVILSWCSIMTIGALATLFAKKKA